MDTLLRLSPLLSAVSALANIDKPYSTTIAASVAIGDSSLHQQHYCAMPQLILFLFASSLAQQYALPSPTPKPTTPCSKAHNYVNMSTGAETVVGGCGCNTLSRRLKSMRRRLTARRLDDHIGKRRTLQVFQPEEIFHGKLLGVAATVVLLRSQKKARITLSGIPVGGKVSGEASFANNDNGHSGSGGGSVVVSGPLAGVLRRRGVSMLDAAYDKTSDTVKVAVRLPIFGRKSITLLRSTTDRTTDRTTSSTTDVVS